MKQKSVKEIKCAVVGYGRNFNFGRMHCRWIMACSDLKLAAVCDIDPISCDKAKKDFPQIEIYDSVEGMLKNAEIDLIAIVTPHNTHESIALECLKAGKHVLVDKAMATSVEGCTRMIAEAKRHNRSLAVFHNRRHDGNYRAIKELVDKGLIGDIFHVECCEERYGHPGNWWYSSKEASGGVFFFWGPHAVDWVLNLIPSRVSSVTGFMHKKVWMDVAIEDEIRAYLLFKNGVTAAINYSTISCVRRPLWRILGTKGAIEDSGKGPIAGATIPGYGEKLISHYSGSLQLVTVNRSKTHESKVPYKESDWLSYYIDLAAHLLRGKPVPVSGEEGRRVVAVLETAEKSARSGHTEPMP